MGGDSCSEGRGFESQHRILPENNYEINQFIERLHIEDQNDFGSSEGPLALNPKKSTRV